MGRRPQPRGVGAVRAVVIGGGLAGISAALELADSGARVTLLEVRPRLGGAAYSFTRDGLAVDNGQHVFLRCCTEYRALLERLRVTSRTHVQERLSIPLLAPNRRPAHLSRTALPPPLHLAAALARYPYLSLRERIVSARAALALERLDRDDPHLDDVSFGEWLGRRGVGSHAVEALWDVIALPTLNLRASDASLALAAMVFQTGLLESADAGDIGYARVPLSALHDEPARRALAEAGVDVRLRARATAVRIESERPSVVLSEETIPADAAIVAVPHDRAGEMLPRGALEAPLDALGVSPIVNLHVVYDRAVTDLPFAAGVGTPVQYVFDRSAQSGLREGQYLAVSLSGAEREMGMSSEDLRREFLPAIASLLPRARDATVVRFFVTREHAATFRAAPGSARLRPGTPTGLRGVYLAGAWTATGWPATMEGAVRSGHAAAAAARSEVSAERSTLVASA